MSDYLKRFGLQWLQDKWVYCAYRHMPFFFHFNKAVLAHLHQFVSWDLSWLCRRKLLSCRCNSSKTTCFMSFTSKVLETGVQVLLAYHYAVRCIVSISLRTLRRKVHHGVVNDINPCASFHVCLCRMVYSSDAMNQMPPVPVKPNTQLAAHVLVPHWCQANIDSKYLPQLDNCGCKNVKIVDEMKWTVGMVDCFPFSLHKDRRIHSARR